MGTEAHPLGRIDLVSHQCQQRRDDERRPAPLVAQQLGGDPVHGRLAPSGPLDHQDTPTVPDQSVDRGELVVAQTGIGPGQRDQQVPGSGRELGGVHARDPARSV